MGQACKFCTSRSHTIPVRETSSVDQNSHINQLLLKKGRTKVGEYLAIIATARVNHRNETASRSWLRGFSWEHSDNTQCGEYRAVFHAVCFTDSEIQKNSTLQSNLEKSQYINQS